ncbi:unnamed protein product [Mytilus edulis]|uniref:Uncharacterized protein n=1 Tax=Mytilus edulis TaxID=6550 RepID=A0A8S3PQ06_MYTED|nr:unnamed protein product [Mytilus edulis]
MTRLVDLVPKGGQPQVAPVTSALSKLTKHEQPFYNSDFLNRWRKKGRRARSTLPGHEYFSAVEVAIEKHQIGELYFEYLKYPNDGIQYNWLTNYIDIGPRLDPIPKPVPGTKIHCKKIVDTPRLNAVEKENGQKKETTGDKAVKEADDYQNGDAHDESEISIMMMIMVME